MAAREERIGEAPRLPAGALSAGRAERPKPLEYLPVGLFASVMGLAGLSAAWGLASRAFGAPLWISTVLAVAALATFAILAIAYLAEAAHRRAGCSFLNAAQDVLDPNIFHLTEGWISEEAFHEHIASDAFQDVLREALELRIIERSGTMYFVAGEQTLDMPS